ncbi:hypothetical protein [Haloterrigena salifodinae]|uniref:hypothetical protein n=1 Tax=Haloterrigena salifodinae TaxID=2675099 RepID=UPI000F87463B|nr:hypothetical protein [Haloterrigena salifodinae]
MKDNNTEDHKLNRRKAIKSGAFAAAGLGVIPAVSSAEESNSQRSALGSEEIVLNDNGELELAGNSSNRKVRTEIEPATEAAKRYNLEDGIEEVNDLVNNSHLEFDEKDGVVYIEGDLAAATRAQRSTIVTPAASDCGKNDFSANTLPPSATVYLNNYWSGRVCAGTGIIAALSGAGVISGPGAVPAWVVAAAAGVSAAVICANNEGCGVSITLYPGVGPKVDPQDNPNNSWI